MDAGGGFSVVEIAQNDGLGEEPLKIIGAYPNPFNPHCRIQFKLPESGGTASLCIFDLAGRKVKKLYSGQCDGADHTVKWIGDSDNGVQIGSGVYFATLQAGSEQTVQKLVVLR